MIKIIKFYKICLISLLFTTGNAIQMLLAFQLLFNDNWTSDCLQSTDWTCRLNFHIWENAILNLIFFFLPLRWIFLRIWKNAYIGLIPVLVGSQWFYAAYGIWKIYEGEFSTFSLVEGVYRTSELVFPFLLLVLLPVSLAIIWVEQFAGRLEVKLYDSSKA